MELLSETFHDCFGIPLPAGMLPEEPLHPFSDAPCLFGSGAAHELGPALAHGDLSWFLERAPRGYVLVGFFGHGVQSHAFHYARADAQSRVYFRLPYGGVYMDNELAARRIRAFLTGYFAVEPVLRERTTRLVAVDAMGAGRYQLSGKDGTRVEVDRSLLGDASFESFFAPILRVS